MPAIYPQLLAQRLKFGSYFSHLVDILRSMPVSMRWYNDEQDIVVQQYTGDYGVYEYFGALDELNAMIVSRPVRVDVILDMTEGTLRPTGVMEAIRRASSMLPPGDRVYVVVGAPSSLVTMLRLSQTMLPLALRFLRMARSLEEAVALIDLDRKGYDSLTPR
jgi:hypothetical protein